MTYETLQASLPTLIFLCSLFLAFVIVAIYCATRSKAKPKPGPAHEKERNNDTMPILPLGETSSRHLSNRIAQEKEAMNPAKVQLRGGDVNINAHKLSLDQKLLRAENRVASLERKLKKLKASNINKQAIADTEKAVAEWNKVFRLATFEMNLEANNGVEHS